MKITRFVRKVCNKIEWNIINPIMKNKRKKSLKKTSFTIISNNCWGGRFYDYVGLQKMTPTVGCYFYAKDYVKFCKNLRYYLSLELQCVSFEQSKYKDILYKKGQTNVPIGKLDDIEVIFLHYSSFEIAKEKWDRRIKRIDWDNIIIKFSYQNLCDMEIVEDFMSIQNYPKFCLIGKEDSRNDLIYYRRRKGLETIDETENFNWYIKPIKLINDRLY